MRRIFAPDFENSEHELSFDVRISVIFKVLLFKKFKSLWYTFRTYSVPVPVPVPTIFWSLNTRTDPVPYLKKNQYPYPYPYRVFKINPYSSIPRTQNFRFYQYSVLLRTRTWVFLGKEYGFRPRTPEYAIDIVLVSSFNLLNRSR